MRALFGISGLPGTANVLVRFFVLFAICYQVNMPEARSQLSALLARVAAGEEVVISRANKPIARLVPYRQSKPTRCLGEAKGLVEIPPDVDQLPDDFMKDFMGGCCWTHTPFFSVSML